MEALSSADPSTQKLNSANGEDGNADIGDTPRKSSKPPNPLPCPLVCKRRGEYESCVYIISCVCFVCTFVMLIVFGIIFVAPYRHVQGFVVGVCHVTEAEMTGEEIDCNCGKRCASTYPCLRIKVNLERNHSLDGVPSDIGGDDSSITTDLYSTEYMLGAACSVEPTCYQNKWVNEEAVKKYKDDWGVLGQSYRCYYNPDEPTQVIKEKGGTQRSITITMVIPGVLAIFCLLVFICTYHKLGCADCIALALENLEKQKYVRAST